MQTMFTRQHYCAIANALVIERPIMTKVNSWDEGTNYEWHTIVLAFATMFAKDNPNFDRERFLTWCYK